MKISHRTCGFGHSNFDRVRVHFFLFLSKWPTHFWAIDILSISTDHEILLCRSSKMVVNSWSSVGEMWESAMRFDECAPFLFLFHPSSPHRCFRYTFVSNYRSLLSYRYDSHCDLWVTGAGCQRLFDKEKDNVLISRIRAKRCIKFIREFRKIWPKIFIYSHLFWWNEFLTVLGGFFISSFISCINKFLYNVIIVEKIGCQFHQFSMYLQIHSNSLTKQLLLFSD